MTYKDNNAVYALNSYLWKVLEANLGWTVADYAGARPIIPSAQQPELMEKGKPFIVYGNSNPMVEHLYAMRTQSVAYTVYSESSTEANRVVNLLMDVFEGQDETAARINDHLEKEVLAGHEWRGVSFGCAGYKAARHAEPATDEGGYVSSYILLEIEFTVDNSSAQLTGFTYP